MNVFINKASNWCYPVPQPLENLRAAETDFLPHINHVQDLIPLIFSDRTEINEGVSDLLERVDWDLERLAKRQREYYEYFRRRVTQIFIIGWDYFHGREEKLDRIRGLVSSLPNLKNICIRGKKYPNFSLPTRLQIQLYARALNQFFENTLVALTEVEVGANLAVSPSLIERIVQIQPRLSRVAIGIGHNDVNQTQILGALEGLEPLTLKQVCLTGSVLEEREASIEQVCRFIEKYFFLESVDLRDFQGMFLPLAVIQACEKLPNLTALNLSRKGLHPSKRECRKDGEASTLKALASCKKLRFLSLEGSVRSRPNRVWCGHLLLSISAAVPECHLRELNLSGCDIGWEEIERSSSKSKPMSALTFLAINQDCLAQSEAAHIFEFFNKQRISTLNILCPSLERLHASNWGIDPREVRVFDDLPHLTFLQAGFPGTILFYSTCTYNDAYIRRFRAVEAAWKRIPEEMPRIQLEFTPAQAVRGSPYEVKYRPSTFCIDSWQV
jgi:hypothetical protein